jgi:hypothetical protein
MEKETADRAGAGNVEALASSLEKERERGEERERELWMMMHLSRLEPYKGAAWDERP